jgi:hypothetical protein
MLADVPAERAATTAAVATVAALVATGAAPAASNDAATMPLD